jgi:hypothetical protein
VCVCCLLTDLIECDSGDVDSVCIISTKQVVPDGTTLSGSGVLYVQSNAALSCTSSMCSLVLSFATNITIDTGGSISGGSVNVTTPSLTVMGTLSSDALGSGIGLGIGGSSTGGGGYGGDGGGGGGIAFYSTTNPSFQQPWEFGSGGQSSAGGGRLSISVSTLFMSSPGRISSDGQANGCNTGSGGSLVIVADVVSGFGSISASGGSTVGSCSSGSNGSGGGGRIGLLIATSWAPTINAVALGGTYYNDYPRRGGPGSVYRNIDGVESLTYDGTTQSGCASTSWPANTPPLGATMRLNIVGCCNLVFTITAPTLTASSITLSQGTSAKCSVTSCVLTLSANTVTLGSGSTLYSARDINLAIAQSLGCDGTIDASSITIDTTDATLDPRCSITSTGRGYQAQSGPGAGASSRSGGSYGGNGGGNNLGRPAYLSSNDITAPWDFGSGGSLTAGGGRSNLTCSGTLLFNQGASISSNGVSTNNDGSGSGGSVIVRAHEIQGVVAITAAGGDGYYGGGGGGRVSVIYAVATKVVSWSVTALMGVTNSGNNLAGSGTVYVGTTDGSGAVIIENQAYTTCGPTPWPMTLESPWTDGSKGLAVKGCVRLSFGKNMHFVGSDFALQQTYPITCSGSCTALSFNVDSFSAITKADVSIASGVFSLRATTIDIASIITASTHTLDAAASISISGSLSGSNITLVSGNKLSIAGKLDTSGQGYDANSGPGTGGFVAVSGRGGGGAYGGAGGNDCINGGDKGGQPYGSVAWPTDFGSGGGSNGGNVGANGGGAIYVQGTSITIDGALYSNGAAASKGAGGAGGSILLVAQSVAGAGALSAIGGTASNSGGGGGGGRIAIWYNHTLANSISAFTAIRTVAGGSSCTNGYGASGTSVFACAAGMQSTASGCVTCPVGTFSELVGSTNCTKCPIGYISAAGATACTACAAGSSSNAAQSACVACDAGYYSAAKGSACVACAAGSYSPSAASTTCTACPAGSYSPSAASSTCSACLAGSYSPSDGSTNCTVCPAGWYSPSDSSSTCTICPVGYSTNGDAGASTCSICDAGTFASRAGTASCSLCSAGFSSATGSRNCTACLPGSYSPQAGSPMCTPCANGTIAPNAASSTCNTCINGNTASDDALECVPCPPGTYGGYPSCVFCKSGYYSGAGATSCQQCPSDTYSSAGSGSCSKCPSKQCSNAGSYACTPCPAYPRCDASTCPSMLPTSSQLIGSC